MDRPLDGVDGVVHSPVVRLGRAVHVDGAVQERGVVLAGEVPQLLDEGGAFLLRDEVGGLHSVHQQFQFRQLQQTGADGVAVLHTTDADNIHAEVHEQMDIAVDIFSVGLDVVGCPNAPERRAQTATNSIGSVVPIERLFRKTLFFDSLTEAGLC